MTIEKLHVLPTHEKVEDGYAYNEKFIGKVYQYKDLLIYFKEKSIVEFPIKIFEEYKELIINEINQNNKDIKDSISMITDQELNSTKLLIQSQIDSINKQIINLENEFNTLKEQLPTKEDISSIINVIVDKKLTEVYNNFNSVTQKLVTDAINDALKDSKRDQSGKLKMSTLMMAKEMGLTPDEIIKYSENGLL